MRPISITIQGLMSYKEKQTLTFEDWKLFVLTGSTGAGKSSIIDAIVFAFYGEIPRISTNKELISKGSDKIFVDFEFVHREKNYRIIRQLGKKHQVEIHEKNEDKNKWEKGENLSVEDFKKFIINLIGLDFKAFTRVIALPQGEFDKFLKPESKSERRKLLINLANLEIYNKISEKAKEKRDSINEEVNSLKKVLETFNNVSPEIIKELEDNLQINDKKSEELSKDKIIIEQRLIIANKLFDSQKKLNDLQQKLSNLELKKSHFENIEITLSKSKLLLELESPIKELKVNQGKEKSQKAIIDGFLIKKQQLKDQKFDLEPKLKAAQVNLEYIPTLKAKEREFQDLKVEVNNYISLKNNNLELSNDIDKQTTKKIGMEEQFINLNKSLNFISNELENLTEKEKYFEINEEYPQILQDCLNNIDRLKEYQTRIKNLEDKNNKKTTDLALTKRLKDDLEKKIILGQNEIENKKSKLEENTLLIRKEEIGNKSVILRQELKLHDSCPVCLQTVNEIPNFDFSSNLKELEKISKQLQFSISELEKSKNEQEIQYSNYKSKILILEEEIVENNLSIKEEKTKFDSVNLQIEPILEKYFIQDMESVSSELEKVRAKIIENKKLLDLITIKNKEKESCINELKILENDMKTLVDMILSSTQKRDNVVSQLSSLALILEERLKVKENFLETLQNNIREVQQKIKQFEEEHKSVNQLYLDKQSLLVEISSKLETHEQSYEELVNDIKSRENILNNALSNLNYSSIDEAEKNIISKSEIANLEKSLQEYITESQSVKLQKQIVMEEINGQFITIDEINELDTKLTSLNSEIEIYLEEKGSIKNRIAHLKGALEECQKFTQDLENKQVRANIYEQIVKDSQSGNLQDFIFNRIMENLIEIGSQELYRMTKRYTFSLEDEELVILDEWNAGEARPIKTLSGGETFMASLSFALALNDYLSQNNHLGSLFIDEGFGSLDPDSLDQAFEAIESLTNHGKLIGVITHVADFSARFPVRVFIDKKESGSTINVYN